MSSDYQPCRTRAYIEPKTPDAIKLGKLEVGYRTVDKSGGTKRTEVDADVFRAAAGVHDDYVYMLDIVCSVMQYRAIHACLTSGGKAKFKFRSCGIPSFRDLEREPQYGYHTYQERFMVGNNRSNAVVHYLAVSKHPAFLPVVDTTSLAFKLQTTQFSTPFLSPALHGPDVPDWMPYILDEAIGRDMVEYLSCHNANSGMVHPRENILQEIIKRGVNNGSLPWPAYDPAEIEVACAERDAGLMSVEEVEDDEFVCGNAIVG
jgi:hypothetical protein